MTDTPIDLLAQHVHEHGEVHAVVEEPATGEYDGEEIEIRKGTAEFDHDNGVIAIQGADTTHYITMDSVLRWYKPTEATH